MIIYLCKKGHDYTLKNDFLTHWRPDLAKTIRIQSYESLFRARQLPLCTYVFADIERLDPDEQEEAARIYETLEQNDPTGLRINHPLRSKRRFGLLSTLHDEGWNTFNIHRAGDHPRPSRFPVFVRDENGHHGPVSPLIDNQIHLDNWLNRFRDDGRSLDKYVVVEFLDTRTDGSSFMKFGAYCVNGRIIAQHILYDNQWVVKFGDGQAHCAARVEFEAEYARTQPHRDQLATIFDMANIGYGRIDYGLLDGRVQTYEVNTNPSVVPTKQDDDLRASIRRRFISEFSAALMDIDTSVRGSVTIEPSRRPVYQALRTVYHDVGSQTGWFKYRNAMQRALRGIVSEDG